MEGYLIAFTIIICFIWLINKASKYRHDSNKSGSTFIEEVTEDIFDDAFDD